MTAAVAAALLDALPIAHELGLPHQEPAPSGGGGGGGASTAVILAGVVCTLAVLGALVWLKNRAD